MEKFNWRKAFGFGILIWLVMFSFVSFISMGLSWNDNLLSRIVSVIVAGVLSYLLARNINPYSILQAFNYGLTWVIIGVALDMIISMQFSAIVFSRWEYSLVYIFILIGPILRNIITTDFRNNNHPAGAY